ncbi:MAG: YqiA/YcfP family alpha/beta fold hydrolase, partial [Thermoanaerobaculia bacterium]
MARVESGHDRSVGRVGTGKENFGAVMVSPVTRYPHDRLASTMRVLYFHGFASSPASAKITALRPILERDGIELVTPDLNVPSFEKLDWDAVVRLGVARG